MGKFTIPKHTLYICTGSKCAKRGGKEGYKMAKNHRKMLPDNIDLEIIRTECTDRCDYAPVCALQPGNIWLKEYGVKQVLALIDELTVGN